MIWTKLQKWRTLKYENLSENCAMSHHHFECVLLVHFIVLFVTCFLIMFFVIGQELRNE